MKYEIVSQEKNIVVTRVVYEAHEVDEAVSASVREISSRVNLKGFRKGRAPRRALEMFVGRGAIISEAARALAERAIDEAAEGLDIISVAPPSVGTVDLKEGQELTFDITFEARPEVTLPDLAELSAERTVYTASDQDLETEIERLRDGAATLEPTDEDRPATAEDIVEVQYSSSQVLEKGDKVLERERKTVFHLSTLRSDIREPIVGHKPAEEFTFEIKMEDDYPDKNLAGARIRYEMEIVRFRRREVPEMTDDLARALSGGRLETVDALRDEVRKALEGLAKDRSESSLRESALEALSKAAIVDVPDTMVLRQYDAMRSREEEQIKNATGKSLEEYLAETETKPEDYERELKESAARIVRNTLVLDTLIEREEISFTQDDLSAEIIEMAQNMRMNPQTLADQISGDRDQFIALADRVRHRNGLKYLAEHVEAVDVEPKEEHKEDKD